MTARNHQIKTTRMTTTQQKNEIRLALKNYVAEFPSQKRASETLNNCSEATIIQIIKGDWTSISDKMWINIGKQLGCFKRSMNLIETFCFQTLILYFSVAKEEGATFALVGAGGSGKSAAAKFYTANNRSNNVFYLECAEYWNKKFFLQKLLQTMGISSAGFSVSEMMERVVREMRTLHQPLVILDEVDKLSDPVLKFFITFYNELNGLCGFVWTSTNAIEKKIMRAYNKNTVGFQEILSRIGSRFIELPRVTPKEVYLICEANGITDQEEAAKISNEVAQLGGDLRRVERNFLKSKVQSSSKELKRA
jgi:Cdc6-like AAA superfamily ATPase